MSNVQAGRLDDLESASTKSSSRSSSSSSSSRSSSSSSSDNSIGGAIAGAIAEVMVEVLVKVTAHAVGAGISAMAYGGENSLHRYQRTQSENVTHTAFERVKLQSANGEISAEEYNNFQSQYHQNALYRAKGDPILPAIRLSSQWLTANSDIQAQLYRIEAGYGLFGVSVSQNNLQEDGDSLTLSNALAHYRMSFGNNFSWDLAFGSGKMNGNQSHDGSVFAMPIRYRFNPDWHFEYYPVWSSYKGGSLAEHQFSFNYHYKHLGATLGYKTWSAGSTSVEGLFTGLYLSF
jgi:uncharacterized membrane protein